MPADDGGVPGSAGCKPLVADKWSLRVARLLEAGPRRFTELKRDLPGISQRMLTVTVRTLERDGILTRKVNNVMPPNVSYELTSMGETLLEAFTPLRKWGTEYLPLIDAARDEYDSRARDL